MTENTSIENNALCRAITEHFPDGQWELVQNQDEEPPLITEPIPLTDEEQVERDNKLCAILEEEKLFTWICYVVRESTLADVRFFVETHKADIDIYARDGSGGILLHIAAKRNPDPDVLKYIISQGADVNAKDTLLAKPR